MSVSSIKMLCVSSMVVASLSATGADAAIYRNDFSNPSEKLLTVGRGSTHVGREGVLVSKDNYASFGAPDMKDYSVSFRARAPKGEEQVQIWCGFRAANRFDRYILGIKGGIQNNVMLMRMGYKGNDELMGVRPLGFTPRPGEWIDVRIEVVGNRMRVFLNGEEHPHMDITDPNASRFAPEGGVTLGGSWILTEFDDLVITPLAPDALDGVSDKEWSNPLTPRQKEDMRRSQRASYAGKKLDSLSGARTELSLDGDWLFMPGYSDIAEKDAVDPDKGDSDWHVMNVPDFWNPIRIWLHGETMGTPRGHMPKGVSDTYYMQETARCEGYTFDYRRTRDAWYRQWVDLPQEVEGRNIRLTFDAVSRATEIYINGKKAGSHLGMYGQIDVDATGMLHPGRNLIALKVIGKTGDGKSPSIDFFYSSVRESEQKDGKVEAGKDVIKEIPHGFYGDDPAGIWQPVKLTITEPVRVDDVYIRPNLSGATFELTVSNRSDRRQTIVPSTRITDCATGSELYGGSIGKVTLAPGEKRTLIYSVDGLKPRLWSPQHPDLYDFTFTLSDKKGRELDSFTETSGFRTFEVRDGLFYLNGHKYWLRGGNHIPFALAPNDKRLADTFMQHMKRGNIDVTRTHTTPWNELWLDAADRNGIGISFEGTWPWLFIHSTPLPDAQVLAMWREEFLGLLKKYRNHPSLLFWTVNNEMKFYDNDDDIERAKEKYRYISDVVGDMRKVDPTRPVCFDSNYQAKGKEQKYGKAFMDSIDDGDIDDMHAYYNWYDYSLFRFFNGEFQDRFKMPDRPLISQEMSTGYPNNETGHPTHSYQIIHQNPESLVGYDCYDYADPACFLWAQSFITGELAEALRRSNDRASGIMHFALLTWFRQVYDADRIEPWPTYYALARALQPVLVSAELWGRHLYAGEKLTTRVCVVNDLEEGRALRPTLLRWELRDERGRVLDHGDRMLDSVPHYGRLWIDPEITIPESLPEEKVKARLYLKLNEDGIPVSANEYELLLTTRDWAKGNKIGDGKQRLAILKGEGADKTAATLTSLGIEYARYASVTQMLAANPTVAIISDTHVLNDYDAKALRKYEENGGRILFLNSNEAAKAVFPEHILSWEVPTEGDITFMERNDSRVFDGIEPLELRYFNNNRREIPTACNTTMQVNRSEALTELAGQIKIHAYIDGGGSKARLDRINSLRGFTMVGINEGKGSAIVSTMATQKADTDPVAARLLRNMAETLVSGTPFTPSI